VLANYDIPFVPQLTALARDVPGAPPMLRELLTDEMAVAFARGNSADFRRSFSASVIPYICGNVSITCFHRGTELLRALKGSGKAQCAGPHTFAALVTAHLPALSYSEVLGSAWDLCEGITRTLVDNFSPSLLLWDDALLPVRASPMELERLQAFRRELAAAGTRLGLHSCAPGRFAPLAEALPGLVLSIDVNVIDILSAQGSDAARRHAAGGGAFIFGVVDTRKAPFQAPPDDLVQSLAALVPDDQALLISGGCGTGLHTPEDERGLAQILRALAT
jgi:hypothetical protein